MENKTVAELEAMTPEEVSALTPQQKATRTKTINASKPATANSGALASGVIAAAGAQKGTNPATPTQADKDAAAALVLKQQKEQADKDTKEANDKKLLDEENQHLQEERERLDREQQEADELQANAEKEEALLAKYGPGYIRAKNGELQTIFSATAWKLMGANKEGWAPLVIEPAEVTQFKNKGGN